jgi:nitrogen fixation protein NifU and related proteins
MTSGWDKFQELVKEQMRRVYAEPFIEHSMDPKNVGDMEDADSYVSVLGSCGDRMELYLKVRDDRITEATFYTDGCSATIACGSMLTELAKNKTLGEALAISAKVLIENLGGLPEDHVHCAGLASLTLKRAVMEYMNLRKEPWKKAYRSRDIRNNPIRVDETKEIH